MIRVCAIQYEMRPLTGFDEFAAQCRYLAGVAAGYKADFALFPEMVTNQLLATSPGLYGPAAIRALGEYTDRIHRFFSSLAVERGVNIIGGSHFTAVGGKTFNIATLYRRDGTTGQQAKLHVTPGEKAAWGISAGDDIAVLATDRCKIAIQICYDVEFPEPLRRATELGAEVVFVPYCTDDRQGHLRVRYCAQARCVENQIYVVTAGVAGNLRGVAEMDVHYAQSAVLTPSDFGFARDGIAAECPAGIEAVAVADLDLEALARARRGGTVRNWMDRREDLYKVQWRPG
jgi:predicted amidohydrolase